MKKKFSEMFVDELLDFCRALYERDGIKALSYSELSKQGALYYNLYRYGVNQKELIVRLGLQEQYQTHKATIPLMRKGRLAQRWTWAHIVKEAKVVKDKEGILPPGCVVSKQWLWNISCVHLLLEAHMGRPSTRTWGFRE